MCWQWKLSSILHSSSFSFHLICNLFIFDSSHTCQEQPGWASWRRWRKTPKRIACWQGIKIEQLVSFRRKLHTGRNWYFGLCQVIKLKTYLGSIGAKTSNLSGQLDCEGHYERVMLCFFTGEVRLWEKNTLAVIAFIHVDCGPLVEATPPLGRQQIQDPHHLEPPDKKTGWKWRSPNCLWYKRCLILTWSTGRLVEWAI